MILGCEHYSIWYVSLVCWSVRCRFSYASLNLLISCWWDCSSAIIRPPSLQVPCQFVFPIHHGQCCPIGYPTVTDTPGQIQYKCTCFHQKLLELRNTTWSQSELNVDIFSARALHVITSLYKFWCCDWQLSNKDLKVKLITKYLSCMWLSVFLLWDKYCNREQL